MPVNIYVNSSKEVVAVDGELSWKYIISNNDDEENIIIEYWEISLDGTKNWEKKNEFKIDSFCKKQVFQSALELIK
jgi:hypothetical protein